MKFKDEKQFQSYFTKTAKERWRWIYKLPDTGYDYKPFDCMIRTANNRYAIELKFMKKNKESIIKKMKPHQIGNIYALERLWASTNIIVYSADTEDIFLCSLIDGKEILAEAVSTDINHILNML